MKSIIMKGSAAVFVLALVLAFSLYKPEESQAVDPSITYPPLHAGIGSPGAIIDQQPENPFFFTLAKTDWPALGIATPRTAWEFVQRGMYFQDDVLDEDKALADYLHAEELLEEIAQRTGDVTLPERMLLIHYRLGPIYLRRGEFEKAIEEFDILLEEDPELEGVNREIALAYEGLGHEALERGEDPTHDFEQAFEHFEEELHNAPNSQITLFEFAHFLLLPEVHLEGVDQPTLARELLQRYLERAEAHCDTYPLRILEVDKLARELGGAGSATAIRNCVDRERVF